MGFTSELYRISLQYEPSCLDAPKTLIAKLQEPGPDAAELLAWGCEREAQFYRDLAGRVGLPVPRCYFAQYDSAQRSLCLLLEDLAPSITVDLERGLSVEQAREVLAALARFHARWWEQDSELTWAQLPKERVAWVRDLFRDAEVRFQERFGGDYPFLARVASQLSEVLAGDELLYKASARPVTLTHNDMQLQNIFFPSSAGGRFAIVDWQSLSWSRHGTKDVTHLLTIGLTPELRRTYGQQLLAYYHKQLRAAGVKGFRFATLKRRNREELATTAVIGVVALANLNFQHDAGARAVTIFASRLEQGLLDARLDRPLRVAVTLLRTVRWLRRLFTRSV